MSNFKIQGGQGPPSDAREYNNNNNKKNAHGSKNYS